MHRNQFGRTYCPEYMTIYSPKARDRQFITVPYHRGRMAQLVEHIVHIDVMLTEGVLALFTSTKTEGCAEKKCTPPSIDKMKEKP